MNPEVSFFFDAVKKNKFAFVEKSLYENIELVEDVQNFMNMGRCSPLCIAAVQGNTETVSKILEVTKNATDKKLLPMILSKKSSRTGQTPLHLVLETYHLAPSTIKGITTSEQSLSLNEEEIQSPKVPTELSPTKDLMDPPTLLSENKTSSISGTEVQSEKYESMDSEQDETSNCTGKVSEIESKSIIKKELEENQQNSNNSIKEIMNCDPNANSIIELLLKYGADPNLRNDFDGQNALHTAILNDHVPIEIIDLLLQYGVDPKMKNLKGETVLHIAVIKSSLHENNLDVVKRCETLVSKFIKLGVPLDEQNVQGLSTLHLACSIEYVSKNIIQLLLDHSCNVNLVTLEGKTAYEIACRRGNLQIAELISKRMYPDLLEHAKQRLEDFNLVGDNLLNGEYVFSKETSSFITMNILKDCVNEDGQDDEWCLISNVTHKNLQNDVHETKAQTESAISTEKTITSEIPIETTKMTISNHEPEKTTTAATTAAAAAASTTTATTTTTTAAATTTATTIDSNKVTEEKIITCVHQKSIVSLIKSHGYPVEIHKVNTKDGYILTTFHIPHGRDSSLVKEGETISEEELEKRRKKKGKPVVFLQHGCFNSSNAWTVCGPEQGLAYILANNGYDVWLGNNRGTQFGREHTTLDTKNPEFWHFSWHEMGMYDVPAQIDYALKHSNARSLSYIGHSQGTTQCFVALSSIPEIQDKINLFIGFAPVVTLKNQGSVSLKLWSHMKTDNFLTTIGLGEVAHASVSRSLLPHFAKYLPQMSLWNFLMDCNIDEKNLPILAQHEPSPTSAFNISHWNQLIRIGRFAQFDYGEERNLKEYNSKTSPEYDLGNIKKTPIAIFYGEHDYLSNPTDVEKFLLPKLSTRIVAMFVKTFKHNDFVWGKNAPKEVYPVVLSLLSQHNIQQSNN